jgi:pterin-4a-carbinolamine dehydratase
MELRIQAESIMNTETPEFETDYASVKADVALMRINCVTKQDLVALEQRLMTRLDERDRRADRTDRQIELLGTNLGHRIECTEHKLVKQIDDSDHRLGKQIDALAITLASFSSKVDAILPHLATKADVLRTANRIYVIVLGAWVTMFLGFVGLSVSLANLLKPEPAARPAAIEQSRTVPMPRAAPSTLPRPPP